MRSTTENQLKKYLGDMLHENDYDADKTADDLIQAVEYVCVKHFILYDVEGLPFEEFLKNKICKKIEKRRLGC